jgi:hypothetical protein
LRVFDRYIAMSEWRSSSARLMPCAGRWRRRRWPGRWCAGRRRRTARRAPPPGGRGAARVGLVGAVGQQHDELVAAEAGEQRCAGHGVAQAPGEGAQEVVARGVAQRVVELLEAVEIDEQHRDGARGAQRLGDPLLALLVEPAPVGQPGEVVRTRQHPVALQCARLAVGEREADDDHRHRGRRQHAGQPVHRPDVVQHEDQHRQGGAHAGRDLGPQAPRGSLFPGIGRFVPGRRGDQQRGQRPGRAEDAAVVEQPDGDIDEVGGVGHRGHGHRRGQQARRAIAAPAVDEQGRQRGAHEQHVAGGVGEVHRDRPGSPPVSATTGSKASADATAPIERAPVNPSSQVVMDEPSLRWRPRSHSAAYISGKKPR